MGRFKINEHGCWETNDSTGHHVDDLLSRSIINILKNEKAISVADFGCGMGNYTRDFLNSGFKCDGFDGNPNTESLTNNLCKVLDLSQSFQLQHKYDWVMSLEVGEHIPKEYEQVFIDNICNHAISGIILSWAIIGQGGDGHINCQNNNYIIAELKKRGWEYLQTDSEILRKNSTRSWFKNTLMIFKK